MILWGWRSDRKGERVWHTSTALFVSAIGLGRLHVRHRRLPLTLVALSIALVRLLCAERPVLGAITEWLAAGAAAAGLAQINALGNLAGFVGPFLLGWIKDQTGSYALGMLPMISTRCRGRHRRRPERPLDRPHTGRPGSRVSDQTLRNAALLEAAATFDDTLVSLDDGQIKRHVRDFDPHWQHRDRIALRPSRALIRVGKLCLDRNVVPR